jgi:hypothetical protein
MCGRTIKCEKDPESAKKISKTFIQLHKAGMIRTSKSFRRKHLKAVAEGKEKKYGMTQKINGMFGSLP